jgi:hypothetical protein
MPPSIVNEISAPKDTTYIVYLLFKVEYNLMMANMMAETFSWYLVFHFLIIQLSSDRMSSTHFIDSVYVINTMRMTHLKDQPSFHSRCRIYNSHDTEHSHVHTHRHTWLQYYSRTNISKICSKRSVLCVHSGRWTNPPLHPFTSKWEYFVGKLSCQTVFVFDCAVQNY